MRLPRRDLWIVFAAGAFLYSLLWFGLLGAMPMVDDAADYMAEAQRLAAQFPASFSKAFYWPPGTALTLALLTWPVDVELWAVRLVTLIASALVVVAIRALTSTLTSDARTVDITTLLALLYPPAVLMSGQSYSYAFAHLWLVLMAWALLQGWMQRRFSLFALAGFAFGLGALTRPSMLSLALPLAACAALAAWRRWGRDAGWGTASLVRAAALFGAPVVVVLAPVVYANNSFGAGPVLSTNNERNFFLGNNRYTPNYKTGHYAWRNLDEIEPEVRDYLLSIYEGPQKRRRMKEEALAYIRTHPGTTLWRTANRIRAFWGFDYVMSRQIAKFYSLKGVAALLLLAVEAGGYLLVMCAFIVGLFHGWDVLAARAGFLLALVVGYQIPYTISFASGLYHFSVMGLLLPFSGAGLRFLFTKGAWRRLNPWVWAALALLVLVQAEYAYHLLLFAEPHR